MGCVEQQGSLFADCQELRLQGAKRSDMKSAITRVGRFADAQKLCFQAVNRSDIGSAVQH